MISRMKYIERWALMRNSLKENISEHSLEVAMISHALAVLGNRRLGRSYDADRVALIAMYHDANEIITGDMPTPVKYYSDEMQNLFHGIEDRAAETLLSMLPEDIRADYEGIFFPTGDDAALKPIVKAADKLSALIKCIEEAKAGNREFDNARKTIEEAIHRMQLPEAEMFLTEFIPSYEKTLDEISK